MNNKINKSLLIVIVAALCLIISGCLGGGTVSDLPESDLPDCETLPLEDRTYGSQIVCQWAMTYVTTTTASPAVIKETSPL